MTTSPDLLAFTKPLRRVLVYLASRDLKPDQPVAFMDFTVGYRHWGRHNLGDRMLDLCLRKLARTGIVTYEELIAAPDRTIAMTRHGITIAMEAYLLAEQNADGFVGLIPPKVSEPISTTRPTRDLTRLYTALTNPAAFCARPHTD